MSDLCSCSSLFGAGIRLWYSRVQSQVGFVLLGQAGLLWPGGWSVGCWSSLVVFGLGTRMVENEITSKSAYVQH